MSDSDSTSGKSPAFQFYPNDFLSDRNVVVMSMQERGVYITLICYAWQSPLPSDVAQLARICSMPLASFRKIWPALSVCFRERDGALVHPRLERERAKQADYRTEKSNAGKRGAAKRWHPDGTAIVLPSETDGTASVLPLAKNSSSALSQSAISSVSSDFSQKSEPRADHRSNRPIFKGQRFVVFEWMLDDLARMLGPHTESFDLHAWFFELDASIVESGFVVPQRDGGKWLHDRTHTEAIKRGLPIAASVTHNPKTAGNLAAAARFVARGQQR